MQVTEQKKTTDENKSLTFGVFGWGLLYVRKH